MAKKIILIALIAILVILIGISFSIPSLDKEVLSETFILDAIYYPDQDYVEIVFEDTSKQSISITLEILGMPESFQKNYSTTKFVERVNFSNPPKYGWQVHPVTLVIDHPEFGKIGIKTEIHSIDEPVPAVIYSSMAN